MGVLRKTVQREVTDILDSSIFTAEDFEVTFGDPDKNEYMILIQFRCKEEYIFSISRLSGSNVQVKRRPGNFVEEEFNQYNGLNYALNEIQNWCKEVRNELKACQPIYNEVDKLRNIIEDHIKGDNASEEFSAEDIHLLRKKFQDLESRVVNLEKDKIITESQLDEFKSGLNQVKEDLEYYPKQTWVKTATNKLSKIVMSIGKSKEGRALIADGARKLLGFD